MNTISFAAVLAAMCLCVSACGQSSPTSEERASVIEGRTSTIWTRGGRWPVDGLGRARIYRGFNVVRKFSPFYEDRFGDDDAALLASEGFTGARIGFIWEAVEPLPGVYDDEYVSKIVALNALMARYGIRTLVDFHQDAWSSQFTGDGAPAWATFYTLSPAPTASIGASEAFAAFWRDEPAADGVGIQTHYINAWKHVVPFMRDNSNVIGFDIFNEAYPGSDYGNYIGLAGDCGLFSACPAFESGALSDFSDRMIAAIRAVDSKHTIYVEPIAGNSHDIALRTFSDPNLGFSYHTYCNSVPFLGQILPNIITEQYEAQICPQSEGDGLDYGLMYAAKTSAIPALTEWSANDDALDNARMIDLMGTRLLSWTR